MAMNKRLSRKQIFFSEVSIVKDDDVYVGIDVHRDLTDLAIRINDASIVDFVMPAEAYETRTTSDESQVTRYVASGRPGLTVLDIYPLQEDQSPAFRCSAFLSNINHKNYILKLIW
jgi:hypothetical protein